jgi:hypothetical protein
MMGRRPAGIHIKVNYRRNVYHNVIQQTVFQYDPDYYKQYKSEAHRHM